MAAAPVLGAFFDEPTNTVSYLAADPDTRHAALIDPVFDFDHESRTAEGRSVHAGLATAKEMDSTFAKLIGGKTDRLNARLDVPALADRARRPHRGHRFTASSTGQSGKAHALLVDEPRTAWS